MKVSELDKAGMSGLKERLVSDEIYITEGREATKEECERGAEAIPDELVLKLFDGVDV